MTPRLSSSRPATLAVPLALALLVAAPARAMADCKVVLSGATTQELGCKAELWQRSEKLWQLIVSVGSSKPFDLAAMVNFTAKPEVGVTYALKSAQVDFVSVLARDKHAKRPTSWWASVKKTRSQYEPKDRPLPPPEGSVDVKLAAVGTAPEVHGTVQATMKAGAMNQPKADVTATFTF